MSFATPAARDGKAALLAPNSPAFRTTSIYPLLSAPTGIRSIPPPEVHREREERWREWRLGGEVTGVSSLEVVVGEGGRLGPSPLSGRDPLGGASPWATGTGEGRTRWKGCTQKLSVLERNSAGKTTPPTAPGRASPRSPSTPSHPSGP